MNVTQPDSTKEFAHLVELQQMFATCESALDKIQLDCDTRLNSTLDAFKNEWAAAKIVRDQAESQIKSLIAAHPEWVDGSSVKTPFGVIQIRPGTRIDVPNPEATLALIDASCAKAGFEWKPEQLTRVKREPNLETLEALSDEQLQKLGCARVKTQSITVKRAKVDLAKASKKKAEVQNAK